MNDHEASATTQIGCLVYLFDGLMVAFVAVLVVKALLSMGVSW